VIDRGAERAASPSDEELEALADLADLIAAARDEYPRLANDMDSEELADAILKAGWSRSVSRPRSDAEIEAALESWRAHEWDPTPCLCACGDFFPAIGRERNGHPEHRMRAALAAADAVRQEGSK
jgi:hypothetical protein